MDIFKQLSFGCRFAKKPSCEETQDPVQIVVQPTDSSIRKLHHIKCYGDDIPAPIASFCHPLVPKGLVRKLEKIFAGPTPVQAQAVPLLVEQPRRDAMIIAPTGTGKTLVFITSILAAISEESREGLKAIVLSPTCELARQTEQEFRRFASKMQRRSVMVTTPLRLVRRAKAGLDLSLVEQLVLDEADRLLDAGFLTQMDDILAALMPKLLLNRTVRIVLLSATISSGVEDIARSFMSSDPARLVIGSPMSAVETIKQELLFAGSEEGKPMALRSLLARSDGTMTPPVMIFTETVERADLVAHQLRLLGLPVASMHASKSAAERSQTLDAFRAGRLAFLATTELLARGLDIPEVRLVLNYDFPMTTASYIHRIGRTGRAGKPGHAITLFTIADQPSIKIVTNVMKQSGQPVPEWMDSLKDERRQVRKDIVSGKSRQRLEQQRHERVFSSSNPPRKRQLKESSDE